MKPYPVKIEQASDDCVHMYLSKGHHSARVFLDALEEYMGDEISRAWGKVYQCWLRKVPAHPDSDYNFMYHEAEAGSRGAFPVTMIDDA